MQKTRKPRTANRPTRSIQLLKRAADVLIYTVRITQDGEAYYYDLTPGTCAGGTAPCWIVQQIASPTSQQSLGKTYHVVLDSDFGSSCDCKGCSRWGRCKHLQGLQALTAAGKLPNIHAEAK
jgi:hypothetical protein